MAGTRWLLLGCFLAALEPALAFLAPVTPRPWPLGRKSVAPTRPPSRGASLGLPARAARLSRGAGALALRASGDEPCGTIEFGSCLPGEMVRVTYTPPAGLFGERAALMYMGGCDGWDGEEDPMMTPMKAEGGVFRANVAVPETASVLDFVVSDGVVFDTNAGNYFHIPVLGAAQAPQSAKKPGAAPREPPPKAPKEPPRKEAAPAVQQSGSISWKSSGGLGVGETLVLTYKPPEGLFKEGANLFYMGGFNGWDGEETPVVFPMIPSGVQGEYRCSINVPNFARELDFVFSDGVRYDTNSEKYFHVLMQKAKGQDEDGMIVNLVRDEGGVLRKAPEPVAVRDHVQDGEMSAIVDAMTKDVRAGDLLPKDVNLPVAERALMMLRSEASYVGEAEGLANIQISEARDYFDEFARDDGGIIRDTISVNSAQRILNDKLGFSMDKATFDGLIGEFVYSERPDAQDVQLAEFLRMLAKIEREDMDVDIV